MVDRDQRLREIRERSDAAKDWRFSPVIVAEDKWHEVVGVHFRRYDQDVPLHLAAGAAFAVESFAREDVPWLLSEVDRLNERVSELDGALCEARELATKLLGPTSKASCAKEEMWI